MPQKELNNNAMKTITLMFAAVAMTFAQAAPATPAPAKDSMSTTAPVKKHSKKHAKKTADTAAKPAPAAPATGK